MKKTAAVGKIPADIMAETTGDRIGATFAAPWPRSPGPAAASERAAACGALAVTGRGPMFGTTTTDKLQIWIRTARQSE